MNNGLIDVLETAFETKPLMNKDEVIAIVKSVTQRIEIDITESDAEDFKGVAWGNDTIKWTFNTIGSNLPIDITFMSEDELEQRNV